MSIMNLFIILTGYSYFYWISFCWRFSEAQTCQPDRQSFIQIIKDKRLELKFSSLKLLSVLSDRNGCVSRCLTDLSCKSANFRISNGECSLYGVNSWENEFTIVLDADNIILQKMGISVVTHGEWTLVFRALAKIGKSVYDAYIDTSEYHDQPLSPLYPIGCLRLDTNMSCDHHFRSKILNNWSSLTITEVKFGIYKDGIMQKFILFNGSSTTFMDWFSSAKLINSSWTDLTTSPIAVFSMSGWAASQYKRRYYVHSSHTGCDNDNGWFVCADQASDPCLWATPGPAFPSFLYSPAATKILNNNMTKAEIFAIFIKFSK